MTTRKTIALTRWAFVGKVMSLLFNMLARLVITFLPRSKCLLISWLQSSSAVILEPLDCEEGWALKNWCFWTVVLEKSLECPLDCMEIQPVHSEGDQPWDFFGRNDAKAEAPVLWPPHEKSWLWKRLWSWEGLGAGVEGDDRGWDGWMASHDSMDVSLSELQELMMDREA